MRRSDFYIKLTTAVLFVAVISYISVYIYDAARNSYQTAAAVSCTIEETGFAEGYIVREETALSYGVSIIPIVSEGEKAARGQIVAVEYKNGAALETESEIRELRLRIGQLEEMIAHGSADKAVQASSSVLELSGAVRAGDLTGLETHSLRIESYIFEGGADPESELPVLLERLRLLEAKNAGATAVRAPASGVFSASADGFESITPDMLDGLTPSKLQELFGAGGNGVNSGGKLITGIKWYYAAVMELSDASRLPIPREVTVQFTGPYRAAVKMTAESMGRSEDGKCVVIFSSGRELAKTASFRYTQAEVVFNAVTGVLIPREAVRLDDEGITYVLLETAGRAERIDVKIIGEPGGGYLVESAAEEKTALRPGALVIVKSNNLTGGEVVPK